MRTRVDEVSTMTDLLLKGGEVIDPSRDVRGRLDVAVKDGAISQVAANIHPEHASRVVDVSGKLVVPGLIDLHVHAFWGSSAYGILPDAVNVAKGVTTVLDAGSSGARTFPGFRHYVIDQAVTRTFALLNISSMGIIGEQRVV